VDDEVLRLSVDNDASLAIAALADCASLTEAALVRLCLACTQLVDADFTRLNDAVNDRVVTVLARNCHGLRRLRLRECKRVSDEGLRELAKGCRQLEFLDVEYCSRVTAAGLTALFDACDHLTMERLVGCPAGAFTLDVLRAAMANQPPNARDPDPHSVDLSGCSWVTEELVLQLLQDDKLRHTKHLKLEGCVRLGASAVAAIAEHLHELVSLDLSRCYRVGDRALALIADSCHDLRVAKLWGMHTITDKGLSALAGGCRSLELLDVRFCQKLSQPELARSRARMPHCKILSSDHEDAMDEADPTAGDAAPRDTSSAAISFV